MRSSSLHIIIAVFVTSAIFILCGIDVYYNSVSRELASDDLLYQSILDDHTLGENATYTHKVTGWADAWQSQKIQYFHSNGRMLVHIILQMFAGVWGLEAFGVFNALAFICIVILFGRLTLPPDHRRNPLCWAIICIGFLYLFQNNGSLWYSYAGSLNYLIPMGLVSGWLLIYRSITTYSRWAVAIASPAIVLFSIMVGWSQECFSLPLSGGVFITLLMQRRDFNARQLLLALPLWVGTAILILSPANFGRFGNQPGAMVTLYKAIRYFAGTWYLWTLIILASIALIRKKAPWCRQFIADHALYIACLVIACAFGCVANTLRQSFSGISFYCAIVSFILLWKLWPGLKITHKTITATVVIVVIVGVHQYRIIETKRELQAVNHKFVAEYIASPDGKMEIPPRHIPADAAPFVKDWYTSNVNWWYYHTLNCHYFDGKKPIEIL